MAEFFMILPQGPNCWMGLGAFSDRVRLLSMNRHQREKKKQKQKKNRSVNCASSFQRYIHASIHVIFLRFHGPFGLRNNIEPQQHIHTQSKKSFTNVCYDLEEVEKERDSM